MPAGQVKVMAVPGRVDAPELRPSPLSPKSKAQFALGFRQQPLLLGVPYHCMILASVLGYETDNYQSIAAAAP